MLHPEERTLLRQFTPWQTLKVGWISLYCLILYPAPSTWIPFRRPKENSPQADEYNAKRHALWLCLLSVCLGSTCARRVADVHEYDNPTEDHRADMCVDLYNNDVGLNLAEEIEESSLRFIGRCRDLVNHAFRNGDLAGEHSPSTLRLGPRQKRRLLSDWKDRTGTSTLPWR